MSRDICICIDFLTPDRKARIDCAASAAGLVPHYFSTNQMEEAAACLQHCEILYAHSPELLRSAPATLQWYCCAYAGVDPYCKDPTLFANPECLLTNSNSYGVTISEHVIMTALMLLRRMPEYQEIVQKRGWENRLPIRSIRDRDFTILGTGDIGKNVAQRLRGMNAGKIIGVSRSGRPQEGFDEVFPLAQLDDVLSHTGFLIMALPGTPETRHILNRDRIALLQQDAYVINVGRGSAIDQSALMDALNSGKLAGAALDVMEPEPLPEDHPLWTTKHLILTPHCSGNTSLDYTCDVNVDLFCKDLENYVNNRPLNGLVDRRLGY